MRKHRLSEIAELRKQHEILQRAGKKLRKEQDLKVSGWLSGKFTDAENSTAEFKSSGRPNKEQNQSGLKTNFFHSRKRKKKIIIIRIRGRRKSKVWSRKNRNQSTRNLKRYRKK